MNTFKKLGDEWVIACDAKYEAGQTITVSLRSGATKQVTIGEHAGNAFGCYLFRVAPKPAQSEAVQVGDLKGVLALFDRAKQHLKHPAIVLSVPAANSTIRMHVAGERAKVPGSLTVLDQDKNWLGRITRDGVYQPSRDANGRTEAIVARLREFSAAPAAVASEHGRLTGACCFCNRALQDERSTAVGYGPICADHYGLPWGERSAETIEREMQKAEAQGDREQTAREEQAKQEAKSAMEGFKFEGWINR